MELLLGGQELGVVDVAVVAGGDLLQLLLREVVLLLHECILLEIKLRLIFLHELLHLELVHEGLLVGAQGLAFLFL